MTKKQSEIQPFHILLSTLIVIIIFLAQNCLVSDNPVRFTPELKTRSYEGNGDGVDGKPGPGEYVRSNNDLRCDGIEFQQAVIEIADSIGKILKDNCQNSDFQFSLNRSNVAFEFYNPSYFTFSGAIFEKLEENKNFHINQALCRYKDNSKGIDAIVTSDNLGNTLSASVIMGTYANLKIQEVLHPKITRTSNETTTSYSDGAYFDLKILGQPQDYKNLSGTLTTFIEGNTAFYPVICQKMSETRILNENLNLNNLVAYWKFDSSNLSHNGILEDSKGLHTGIIVTNDSINKSAPGVLGGAMNFDGIDDYVNMSQVLDMPANDFSVSIWLRTAFTNAERTILAKQRDQGGIAPGWNVHIFGADKIPDARIADGVKIIMANSVPTSSNPDDFHHFVAVYDRTNGLLRRFLDGVPIGNDIDISGIGSSSYNGNFLIGKPDWNLTTGHYQGDLDEISIWTRALTASDVETIFSLRSLY